MAQATAQSLRSEAGSLAMRKSSCDPEVGLSSPIKANQNASDQKRGAKQGTDEIEVVTGALWQTPLHALKEVEPFGDVAEDHNHQTSEAQ
jgi:hypothetical protein